MRLKEETPETPKVKTKVKKSKIKAEPESPQVISTENGEKKKKKKKVVEETQLSKEERVAEALKRPRTRSVSLSLSENGFHDDGEKPKTKKKKVKSKPEVENETPAEPMISVEERDGQFDNFTISKLTQTKLRKQGIKFLFPIQSKTYNYVYDGRDLIAKARTGTGKTLAFALPVIEKLQSVVISQTRGRPPMVMVLAPTRELVNQVAKVFQSLASRLRCECFYGGVPMHPQRQAIQSGIDILCGTPGRILDWVKQGVLDTSRLKHVILDEVDQMLDMGFADDVDSIISHSFNRPAGEEKPQTLLFSATLPEWVRRTSQKYMVNDTCMVDLVGSQSSQTSALVKHLAVRTLYADRARVISQLLTIYSGNNGRAIVFFETKKEVDELAVAPELKLKCRVLHGDIAQRRREEVLKGFRDGSVKVLIATNVAARGLDIPEVDLVIQSEVPTDIESYIHRSGRTGRAGKSGVCVVLHFDHMKHDLIRLEQVAKIKFEKIDPPNESDVISLGLEDVYKTMKEIPQSNIEMFLPHAQKLITELGAEETLAATLALLTGHSNKHKEQGGSLLRSRKGYTTVLFQGRTMINYKGYVFNMLKTKHGDDIMNKISGLTLTQDRYGAVFDISNDMLDDILTKHSDPSSSLKEATKPLPALQELPNAGMFGRGGWPINPFKRSGGRNNNGSQRQATRYGNNFKPRSSAGGNDFTRTTLNKRKTFD